MSWASTCWAASSIRRLALCTVIGICAVAAVASEAAAGATDIGIIITNADYHGTFVNVKYAERDGDAMRSAMQKVLGINENNILWRKDRTKRQLDSVFGPEDKPKEGELWKRVETAWKKNPATRVVVYYSGHGISYDTSDHTTAAGLLAADASPNDLKRGV